LSYDHHAEAENERSASSGSAKQILSGSRHLALRRFCRIPIRSRIIAITFRSIMLHR